MSPDKFVNEVMPACELINNYNEKHEDVEATSLF
jgi:hypothetical protein